MACRRRLWLERRTSSRLVRAVTALGAAVASGAFVLPVAAWAAPSPSSPGGTGVPDVGRALVVRPARVDVVLDGQVVESIVRAPGPIGLGQLAVMVGRPSWLGVSSPGAFRLAAAVVEKPGTDLVLRAPTVTRLQMVNGSGASLVGSNSRLEIDGVDVSTVSEAALAPAGPAIGRGFIHYSGGGRIEITRSHLTGLGDLRPGSSGITAGSDTKVMLSDTRIDGGQVGVTLVRSQSVQLTRVVVTHSTGDGVVLRQVQGALVQDLTSVANGGSGLLVTGGGRTVVMRPVLQRNRQAGLNVNGTSGLQVTDASSGYNVPAGVVLTSVSRARLTNVHTDDEAIGVAVTGRSRQVLLDRLVSVRDGSAVVSASTVSGLAVVDVAVRDASGPAVNLSGSGAVVLRGTVRHAAAGVVLAGRYTDSRIDGLTVAHVQVGVSAGAKGQRVTVRGLAVDDSGIGLRISASRVRLLGLVVSHVKTGVQLLGSATDVLVDGGRISQAALAVSATGSTRQVVLRRLVLQQDTGIGVSSSSPDLQVVGLSLVGGQLGFDLHAAASVVDTTLSGMRDGIRVGRQARVDLVGVRVQTVGPSLWTSRQGAVRVKASALLGRPAWIGPVHEIGHNDLTPGPMPWFGIAGVSAAGCAISLELLRRLRETQPEAEWSTAMPQHVLNRA